MTDNTSVAMAAAMDQLRREGVPEANLRAAAAHLVGQAKAESNLNPTSTHDANTGYGIYSARLGRRDAMLSWLADNGYPKDSVEGQTRYMAHEAMTGRYSATRDTLMNATPENLAADHWRITRDFERPAAVNDRSWAVLSAYGAPGGSLPDTVTRVPSQQYDAQGNQTGGPGMPGTQSQPDQFHAALTDFDQHMTQVRSGTGTPASPMPQQQPMSQQPMSQQPMSQQQQMLALLQATSPQAQPAVGQANYGGIPSPNYAASGLPRSGTANMLQLMMQGRQNSNMLALMMPQQGGQS